MSKKDSWIRVIYRWRDVIYGGGFSINKLYSLVTPPHQAACGVLVKVIARYNSYFADERKISADAKIFEYPPHPSRFACHLPRHGKAYRFASADNRGEDNKAFVFLL